MIRAKVDIMARLVPKWWILVFVAVSLVYNAQSCPDLQELPRGVITYRTVSTRVVATYRCTATGYGLWGERKLRCQDDGTWSNDVPTCRPMPICPEIEEGNHLVRQMINGGRRDGLWVFGSRHNFTCGDGFVLSDPSMSAIECTRQGWNASTPTCIGNERFEAELTSDYNNYDIANISGFIPLVHPVGIELYFMFDVSTSVGAPNFNMAKAFAKRLVKEIGVTSRPNSLRVGAMFFNSQADVAFHTFEFERTEDVVAAINMIEYKGGGTNQALAFDRLLNEMIPQSEGLNREGSFKTVFLLTDGHATEGGNPQEIADLVKGSGVTIHCIGITDDASREALINLASDPLDEHIYFLSRYDDIDSLIKLVTNQSLDYSECGKSNGNTVAHTPYQKTYTSAGAWPWHVLFDIRKSVFQYICSGTLIKPDWILTVAHCFHEIDSFEAYAGIRDRTNPRRDLELLANQTVIIHPDYDSTTRRNDIALVHLRKPAKLSSFVRLACLPDPAKEERLLHHGSAVMTGWGYKGTVQKGGSIEALRGERYLQQISLPLRSREECTDSLIGENEEDWFNEGMTCAGYLNAEVGGCQGDSGGPLIKNAKVNNQRRWVVIGINSWSIGCALPNELDFFTNVPHFMGWINGHITPAVVHDDY